MKIKVTPIAILSLSALVGIVATVIFLLLAIKQPWMGLKFIPEEKIGIRVIQSQGPSAAITPNSILVKVESNKGEIELLPIDLTIEPDGKLQTYDIYNYFLVRQGHISTILKSETVTFTNNKGEKFTVKPSESRPLLSLPVEFWVQIVVGLFAWLISSAVFAFRSRESSAKYLLLSGLATLTFAPFAAIYTTRELAMPEALFRFLSDGNFLGGSIFTASFVALLLCYPKLLGPKWLGLVIIFLFIVWFILQQIGVFTSMTFARRFLVTVGVLSTFGLAAIHWFKTKKDPVARAALQWFLLSWMLGTCLFWFFILMPQMFGVDTTPIQGYAFGLFLLVYAGLTFGILRYKLFALDQWWGNIVLWALTMLILVVFDLLFLLALQFSAGLSISLAFLLSGVLWLPLKNLVWNHFLNRHQISREDLFKQVINIALTPPGQDINIRWQNLLKNIYDPLNIHECADCSDCSTDDDGQILFIQTIGSIPALGLEFAHGGQRMFTATDVTLAKELVVLIQHIIDNRSEYSKGVNEERQRIAQDMHDNIGAQLLGALHNQNTERKNTLIRETLSDLRSIINDTSRTELSFDEMLADLRAETTERLSAASITTSWVIKADNAPPVSPQSIHALRSIIREAISNIIKHAAANFASINIEYINNEISVTIEDNGKGLSTEKTNFGNGLANMKSRITGLSGNLILLNRENGLLLRASFPINNNGIEI
ncbi:MAG: hypothetical protein K9G26_04705 [Emcibacter sp.]|nr:hypothetical protein [Emcibacter sp.]